MITAVNRLTDALRLRHARRHVRLVNLYALQQPLHLGRVERPGAEVLCGLRTAGDPVGKAVTR